MLRVLLCVLLLAVPSWVRPAPPTSQAKTVTMSTKNFYQTIFDPDVEVFLNIFTPWCEHCKELEPIWRELEERYRNNNKVVIAEMNGEENEMIARSVGVKGFPTILLYSHEDKNEPVRYEGKRTLDAMVDFLNDNTGLPHLKPDYSEY